mmetsp:Transcript_2928/g.10495  ORF Transcript_2928/g.10495 Transcript_2928/m.10495 type:complete len:302 (+) Transcript_2928:606-1511(+)
MRHCRVQRRLCHRALWETWSARQTSPPRPPRAPPPRPRARSHRARLPDGARAAPGACAAHSHFCLQLPLRRHGDPVFKVRAGHVPRVAETLCVRLVPRHLREVHARHRRRGPGVRPRTRLAAPRRLCSLYRHWLALLGARHDDVGGHGRGNGGRRPGRLGHRRLGRRPRPPRRAALARRPLRPIPGAGLVARGPRPSRPREIRAGDHGDGGVCSSPSRVRAPPARRPAATQAAAPTRRGARGHPRGRRRHARHPGFHSRVHPLFLCGWPRRPRREVAARRDGRVPTGTIRVTPAGNALSDA